MWRTTLYFSLFIIWERWDGALGERQSVWERSHETQETRPFHKQITSSWLAKWTNLLCGCQCGNRCVLLVYSSGCYWVSKFSAGHITSRDISVCFVVGAPVVCKERWFAYGWGLLSILKVLYKGSLNKFFGIFWKMSWRMWQVMLFFGHKTKQKTGIKNKIKCE